MASTPLVGIFDYGLGNIRSVQSAVETVGGEAVVSSDAEQLLRCSRLILPGVGAFAHGMNELTARGLDDVLRQSLDAGIPLLGICLGMQMLASRSLEFGDNPGLSLISGTVTRLAGSGDAPTPRLPHVAWAPLRRVPGKADWLFDGIKDDDRFYFIHSFALRDDATDVAAWAGYEGVDFAAVVAHGSAVGTQFHPEKSGPAGLRMLNNFVSKGQ
jgi:glutamine amidotransferase